MTTETEFASGTNGSGVDGGFMLAPLIGSFEVFIQKSVYQISEAPLK